MKPFRILLLLAAFPLFFWSCDRTPAVEEPPTLPPITTEGKGTFGCLVNGKVWLPNSKGGFYNPKLIGIRGNNYVGLETNRADGDTVKGFNLFIRELNQIGLFSLIPSNSIEYGRGGGANYVMHKNSFIKSYHCDTILNGEIIILSLDTITPNYRYVSGTFWFDMRNFDDSTDIIQIRDGRFDVRLPN